MSSEWEEAIERSTRNNVPEVWRMLEEHPYLESTRVELRKAKLRVLDNLDEFIGKTMEAVTKSGGVAHLARDAAEARDIVDRIIGGREHIILSKSNVAYEAGIRQHLRDRGKDVWETDFGEYLLQIAEEEPSHIITVALHMTKEKFGRELHRNLDESINEDSTPAEMAAAVRRFLLGKYDTAEVGITGANAVAADTGSVALVENEGNIRMTSVRPQIHIAVTGIDKIVPTLGDAFKEVMIQAAYAGSYPPTYINVTTGPSSTGDIESQIIRPATGPREFHLVLIDNGRMKAAADRELREALLCIRCGRCYFACPTYRVMGKEWGKPPYSGPTGVMWNAIVRGDSSAAHMCTHSAGCREVCPMDINIPRVLEYIKYTDFKKMEEDGKK